MSRSVRLCKLLCALAFWMLVWALAAAWTGQELLVPSPLSVLRRLFSLAGTAIFWQSAGMTLLRVFGGFCLGALSGALLALATSASRVAEALLSPAIRVIRATPVASFILLVLLWAKSTWVPLIIAALMVLPVVWGNLVRGVAETDAHLIEAARVYRFSRLRTLLILYLPSLRPYFAGGCLTAMGLAWKSGVAAEVLCFPRVAVGTQVYYSKLYLETPSLFAWTLVVIVLSLLLERLLRAFLLRGGEAAS